MSTAASVFSHSNVCTPTSGRFPSSTPKISSPNTDGCPRRTARSPPSLAATRMTVKASASAATGSACIPWSITALGPIASYRLRCEDLHVDTVGESHVPRRPFGAGQTGGRDQSIPYLFHPSGAQGIGPVMDARAHHAPEPLHIKHIPLDEKLLQL